MLKPLQWTGSALRLLDQTKLPTETDYLDITDERQMHDAIRRLVVRGAPAIGIAAAFGVYLGVRDLHTETLTDFDRRMKQVTDHLATARPTAVNLFWALDRMTRISQETRKQGSRSEEQMVVKIKARLLSECLAMIEEDNQVCRAIGQNALALLDELLAGRSATGNRPSAMTLLTHCNAGGLATACYGTALSPVYIGAEQGRAFHVYADETRPLLQGARITAYELQQNNIPVTLICDNMAATVMSQGKIDAVIVGTDRVAANGDVANKIGTHGVAILARHFSIPFIVAAPTSSIDLSLATGAAIPIEQRDPAEITNNLGQRTAPEGIEVFNPAFDVTPADLVTAIVTEHGAARPPYGPIFRDLCAA